MSKYLTYVITHRQGEGMGKGDLYIRENVVLNF